VLRTSQGFGRNVGMNRDRLYEFSALIIAVRTIGDNHRLSFEVPRGDAWS
jgi:hypothetical protein